MERSLLEKSSLPVLDPAASGIISLLLYFDIFCYPLTLEEIISNCHDTLTTEDAITRSAASLVKEGRLRHKDGFFFISNDDTIVERRKAGNLLAEKFQKKAARYSSLISKFPFVRCVCISGSLSKGFMGADSDVDYFIITKPGRLWLARTLLVLFKKVFLLNSKKYFCVNYFLDEQSLSIPDKNIFTATELSFIVPTYNYEVYSRLIMENSWCREFYPNKKITREHANLDFRNGMFKRLLEWILNGRLGERLDSWSFNYTIRHWKKKFTDFDETAFDLNLRSRKNVSKHHPQGFQFKVLRSFEESKRRYEQQFGVSLAQ
jgi:hypothetical protein